MKLANSIILLLLSFCALAQEAKEKTFVKKEPERFSNTWLRKLQGNWKGSVQITSRKDDRTLVSYGASMNIRERGDSQYVEISVTRKGVAVPEPSSGNFMLFVSPDTGMIWYGKGQYKLLPVKYIGKGTVLLETLADSTMDNGKPVVQKFYFTFKRDRIYIMRSIRYIDKNYFIVRARYALERITRS